MKKITYLSLIIFSFFSVELRADDKKIINDSVIIAAGEKSSLSYQAAESICRSVNKSRNENQLSCLVAKTDGYLANLKNIINKQADLAIVKSSYQYDYLNDSQELFSINSKKNINSLFSLYNKTITIAVRGNSKITSFANLKDSQLKIATSSNETQRVLQDLASIYGWDKNNFSNVIFLDLSSQAESLCSSKIDVMINNIAHPSKDISNLSLSCDIKLIALSGAEIDMLIKKYPYYGAVNIPAGYYAGIVSDIQSFGEFDTVIALDDMDENIIYKIVKSVFENFDNFQKLLPEFLLIDQKKMIFEGSEIPLHKGAERYFKEKGIL